MLGPPDVSLGRWFPHFDLWLGAVDCCDLVAREEFMPGRELWAELSWCGHEMEALKRCGTWK